MKPIKRGTNLKKRLEEIVSYNPETGVFYWKNLKNKNKKFGAEAYFNFKSEHYGEFFNKDIINEFSFDD